MLWLHTWAGVVLGGLLFAIFWMGTLSVFDKEIDLWMKPDTRIERPANLELDAFAETVEHLVAGSQNWGLSLPSERVPVGRFSYRDSTGSHRHVVDVETGALIPDQGTLAASGFLYPFHYSLHLRWKRVGYWIVGTAAMAMLLLIISGVIVHRRIFATFFTFRPEKKTLRSSLDLHTLSGMLVLPFHFLIPLSGVIVFMSIYFPQAANLAYAGEEKPQRAFFDEAYGSFSREPSGTPAQTSSLDAMLATAQAKWDGSEVLLFRVYHPGDANSYVTMRRAYRDQLTLGRSMMHFDATTGEMLERFDTAPVHTVQRFIIGLHLLQFDHWALRWIYFLAGLSGCILIGTGFVYWLEKRRTKHEKLGLKGVRIVEGLTVGTVTGLLIATLAFFAVNRLLPLGVEFANTERSALEVWTFYLVWILTFAHAWLRPTRAWAEQLWAIAGLSVAAVVLNAATTGDHLIRSFSEQLWPVFSMDTSLLIAALLAGFLALRLRRAKPAEAALQPVAGGDGARALGVPAEKGPV